MTRRYQPLMGNALFCEYEQVISRDESLSLCPLSKEEIQTLLASFMSVCKWIHIYYLWRPNLSDEADNHLIELAVAGNARIIATNNTKDFKRTELFFPELLIQKTQTEQIVHRSSNLNISTNNHFSLSEYRYF